MSNVIPESERVKCLICKARGPIGDGFAAEEGIAKHGGKCPYCGEVGLIRDKRAEARAKATAEEAKVKEAEKAELDKFMYPVPCHTFLKGPGCPSCGDHGGFIAVSGLASGPEWSNSMLVQCDCFELYTWPCVDVRTLGQPGEDKPLSPCDEEARLRELRDDQLKEAFGYGP